MNDRCVQILRMPLFQLPQLISQLVNAQVAITRLREFLAAAEQHTMPETHPAAPGQIPNPCECVRVCELVAFLATSLSRPNKWSWLVEHSVLLVCNCQHERHAYRFRLRDDCMP